MSQNSEIIHEKCPVYENVFIDVQCEFVIKNICLHISKYFHISGILNFYQIQSLIFVQVK